MILTDTPDECVGTPGDYRSNTLLGAATMHTVGTSSTSDTREPVARDLVASKGWLRPK